jgi:gamma-glutamyltranspeptidase/glutathione hydrolase
MLHVMQNGGNAVDAAVAGSLLQAGIEPCLSNHAGTVTFLYWDAKAKKAFQLDATGTLVPGLKRIHPIPPGMTFVSPAGNPPCACIPGFMPGLAAIQERFGSCDWCSLCQPAIRWVEEGHRVSSFEVIMLTEMYEFNTYLPESRALFTPDGFSPRAGDRFRNPELAKTLQRLAVAGPGYFTQGEWAEHFVAAANRLGWHIKMEHVLANPPTWADPLRYWHGEYEILQLAPPQRTGMFSALVLGILDQMDIVSYGHYSESAEALYLMAHVLRRSEWELGLLHDPEIFRVPSHVWLSSDFHRMVAEIIVNSQPTVDLSEHVRLVFGDTAAVAAGLHESDRGQVTQPTGSCELSIVDHNGNWVQMMHTFQSGGIPGTVVDGVNMVGSHARSDMRAIISGWLAGRGRIKSVIGNTIVLRDGRPWLALGTPGKVHVTVPQVLSSILDYGMAPHEAAVQPLMLSLSDDYVLTVESRVPQSVVNDMAKKGVYVKPHPAFDWHMGAFQMCWEDADGTLHSFADPRRAGAAASL